MPANSTCPVKTAPNGPSLFQNGNLVFQAHHVGWIIATFFTIVSCIASFWLVNKHLQWYTNKREQRYIVRILFMVPIYATVSLASYFFWNHATPLLLIRDAYESTVLTSFFYLLLVYLSPDPDEQRMILLKAGLSKEADIEARRNGEEVKRWVFPFGFIKKKPKTGMYFLQLMKWGVLQYCVIRPTTTLAAIILNYMGLYCDESLGLGWGHIYIIVIMSLSVTVAMYCLIQLYVSVAMYLVPHRPLLKLFAIKAVVFLTFWQATALGLLSLLGIVKDTTYMTANDINIGIAALLETFEMMFFAFLHIKAFTYKVYRPIHYPKSNELPPERTSRWRALAHAMDFRETFREIWSGCLYIKDKMRGKQPKVDMSAMRTAHFEGAFGQARSPLLPPLNGKEPRSEKQNPELPSVKVEVEEIHDIGGERQWLGIGNDYAYDLAREKSEDLSVQIERELERRGYGTHIPGRGHIKALPTDHTADTKHHRSWWRSIYDRISSSGQIDAAVNEESPAFDSSQERYRKSRPCSRQGPGEDIGDSHGLLFEYDYEMDDPPPRSLIRNAHSDQRPRDVVCSPPTHPGFTDDTLSPLSIYNHHKSSHIQRKQRRRSSSRNRSSSKGKDQLSSSRRGRHPAQLSTSPLLGVSTPLPAPPAESVAGDSFLNRAFPSSIDGHTTESVPIIRAQNIPNPSNAPFIITSVNATGNERTISMAGERNGHRLGPTHTSERIATSVAGEIVDTLDGDDYDIRSRHSHKRDSAFHQPPLFISSTSPSQADELPESSIVGSSQQAVASPITLSPDKELAAPNRPFRGLRRSSAQIYGPLHPSRRNRHSSLPPIPSDVQIPQKTHRPVKDQPYTSRRSSAHIPDHISTQHATYIVPTPNVQPTQRGHYSLDNTDSVTTQPSLSGIFQANKFPTILDETDLRTNDFSRYPGSSHGPSSPRSPQSARRPVDGRYLSTHSGGGASAKPSHQSHT